MNRGARRRREKEDLRRIANGLDVPAKSAEQICSLMRVLHGLVVDGRQLGSVRGAMSFLFDNLSKSIQQAPDNLIACRKGCSHCCNTWVSATAPEVFFIADMIRRSHRPLEEITTLAQSTRKLDIAERGRRVTPCPLLEDGSCSAYVARPFSCRTATSTDAALCKRGYIDLSGEEIPQSMYFVLQRSGYTMAFWGAFEKAGLPLKGYEFNEALELALTTENAEQRWLSGEDIFADVQRDPGDPTQRPEHRIVYNHAFAA